MNPEELPRSKPSAQRVYRIVPGAEEVGPDFEHVLNYAAVQEPDGRIAFDLRKMGELEGRFGYNGGQGCDVLSGPCSCGAWH